MADILTFEEHRGPIKGKKVVWSGDGNNVFASFAHAAGQIIASAAVLRMGLNGSHFSSYGSEKKGQPTTYYLSAAPEPIRVHKPMEDGQSWQWREFKMTSYFYPGQTRYHDALFVENGDVRMLFVGDSHTMSGIDDYCAYNRNWLGRDVGFQYCLSLIEKLQPTHMFNCHVADAFFFKACRIEEGLAIVEA